MMLLVALFYYCAILVSSSSLGRVWEALVASFSPSAELAAPMGTYQRYDPNKLDIHAHWLDRKPEELLASGPQVAAAGSQFDNAANRNPSLTDPANDILTGGAASDGGQYPDPTNIPLPHRYSYFDTHEHDRRSVTPGDDRRHRAANVPPPSAGFDAIHGNMWRAESPKMDHLFDLGKARVVDNGLEVEESPAATRVRGKLSSAGRGRIPAKRARQHDDTFEPNAVDEAAAQLARQDGNTLDFTQRQESVYPRPADNLHMDTIDRTRTSVASSSTTLVERYPCTVKGCTSTHEKPFMTPGERDKHETSHSIGFECTLCRRKFKDQRRLDLHLTSKEHMEKSQKRPTVCHICQEKLARKDYLMRHLKARHPEEYERRKSANTKRRSSSTMSSQTAVDTQQTTPTTNKRALYSPPAAPKASRSSYDKEYSAPGTPTSYPMAEA